MGDAKHGTSDCCWHLSSDKPFDGIAVIVLPGETTVLGPAAATLRACTVEKAEGDALTLP